MAYFRLNTAENEAGDDLFICKRCGLVGGCVIHSSLEQRLLQPTRCRSDILQSFWRIVVRRWERGAVGLGKKEVYERIVYNRVLGKSSTIQFKEALISVAFLALSPAVSPELPLRSVEIEDPFGFTDAEETTVFSLILQSVEIEDPFGFTYAEETAVLSLILRSVEIKDLPVGSIAMNFRENIINFEGRIR
ncbi:LOW QUALITY PROTEIN: hypothetical protein HID58_001628 [Brassica napus]|uniref:DNA-directed RNA polymerase n=1 Tax=Brassica napus TaxID=3708 RepID=A0ABQ8EMZ2_BRANA|nr:LOW QUALITY PROTEIN: hypothetical protein HID58_001628 [Brassica napus]